LPELYRQKYGSNVIGFTDLTCITIYSNKPYFNIWYNVNLPTY